jgi:hypothetical protein
MPRIAEDILLTNLEVALAVAPKPVLCGLNADDPRQLRNARVELAQHLVERMRGFVIEGEGGMGGEGQACLFPGDLSPIG